MQSIEHITRNSSISKIWLYLAFLIAILALGLDAHAATRNILITGYWAPTNLMMKRLSPDPILNPEGWLGRNYLGSGYDVYAYFPTFKNSRDEVGEGDFPVDFAATYNDFMRITETLAPIAAIGFGFDPSAGWELETRYPAYHNSWFKSGQIPSVIREQVTSPIPESLKLKVERSSSLPVEAIAETVNRLPGRPVKARVDRRGDAGDFLCGFMGYLLGWYHEEHSLESDPKLNKMAGFIHVNTQLPTAQLALEATLSAVIENLGQPGEPSEPETPAE